MIDSVCFELNLYCPLRCLHCSANASDMATRFIRLPTVAACLSALGPLQEVYLSGGEPFSHREFLAIARTAASNCKLLAVYSSGTRLNTRGAVAALRTSDLGDAARAGVKRIDLSLYAPCAADHDRITERLGSFHATVETARRVRAAGIQLGLHVVPELVPTLDLHEVADFATELGASRLHLLALARHGRARGLEPMSGQQNWRKQLTEIGGINAPYELLVSSLLRLSLGLRIHTERDCLVPCFIDVHGYVYPREDLRESAYRSHVPVTDLQSALHVFRDVSHAATSAVNTPPTE